MEVFSFNSVNSWRSEPAMSSHRFQCDTNGIMLGNGAVAEPFNRLSNGQFKLNK